MVTSLEPSWVKFPHPTGRETDLGAIDTYSASVGLVGAAIRICPRYDNRYPHLEDWSLDSIWWEVYFPDGVTLMIPKFSVFNSSVWKQMVGRRSLSLCALVRSCARPRISAVSRDSFSWRPPITRRHSETCRYCLYLMSRLSLRIRSISNLTAGARLLADGPKEPPPQGVSTGICCAQPDPGRRRPGWDRPPWWG